MASDGKRNKRGAEDREFKEHKAKNSCVMEITGLVTFNKFNVSMQFKILFCTQEAHHGGDGPKKRKDS